MTRTIEEKEQLISLYSRESNLKHICSLFYDYKMPSFNYNAGVDFELSYKIIQHEKTNEGYSVSVKYILAGSQGTFSTTEVYNVVNLDGIWYAKMGDNYGISSNI